MTDPMRWRTGRTVGRTVYRQEGPEPSDNDSLIGVMDSPHLAALVVAAVNRSMEQDWKALRDDVLGVIGRTDG